MGEGHIKRDGRRIVIKAAVADMVVTQSVAAMVMHKSVAVSAIPVHSGRGCRAHSHRRLSRLTRARCGVQRATTHVAQLIREVAAVETRIKPGIISVPGRA